MNSSIEDNNQSIRTRRDQPLVGQEARRASNYQADRDLAASGPTNGRPLQSGLKSKIAIIPAKGLGDGLIQMILAFHLAKQGHPVTFFHNFLFQMHDWFPSINILPAGENSNQLHQYDQVIILDYDKAEKIAEKLPNCIVPPKKLINKNITMLENIMQIGRICFGLEDITKNNGIKIPKHLAYQNYKNRIIIHPTSTDESKNWPAKKFLKLARKLKQNNFDPIFTLSPKEQERWKNIINDEFEMPHFETIDTLASYIFESYSMIGNDSGIGHLASNLGLPTLSIFSSEKRARLWRPSWGKNRVVTPKFKLPGKWFNNSWKWFLTPHQVFLSFIDDVKTDLKPIKRRRY